MIDSKNKSDVLTWIIILFFGLVFIIAIYKSNEKEIKEPVVIVGVIKDTYSRHNSGSFANVAFSVNNKNYKGTMNLKEGVIVGEKYKIIYSSSNPKINKVINEAPVFLETEKTNFTTGKIQKIMKLGNRFVYFEYEVAGNKYVRPQNYDKTKYNPLNGELFKVEYLISNPQRAIIYFEENLKFPPRSR